jgi:hypothetical protein
MLDPHAYHDMFGTWKYPADKHVPRPINPPYGSPKFPSWSELNRAEKALMIGLVLPVLALGATWRVVSRDLFGSRRLLR